MIFASVCSGIEAASVAWSTLGWRASLFAEIDPFACALLDQRWPQVPNFGDITRAAEWPDGADDVLVGGTPCQAFSIAGWRGGLADPRGHLTLAYLAVAARRRPRWLVWENVPGVLSVDDGRAFAALVSGLVDLGYGVSWRVLDAQYFGLAQRRARVFVVGHLGDWRRAAAVLFERASLSGHPAPRRDPRHTARRAARECAVSSGDVAYALNAGGTQRIDAETETLIAFQESQSGCRLGDVHATLDANNGTRRQHGVIGGVHQVRRLTPRECERLQGFADDYTLVRYRGRLAADLPRYRALGNSVAVPVLRWIGDRLARVDALEEAA